jgi:hypothetical protein
MNITGKTGLLSIVASVAVVGFSFAGCGTQPTGDTLEVEASSSALQNTGGYTTRDICKACGCVASDVACDCGTPPSKKKLGCIDNGGPSKIATSAAAGITSSTSATLQSGD